jgi:hypothetical protein
MDIRHYQKRKILPEKNENPLQLYSVCAVDILASICLHDLVGHNFDILYGMRVSFTMIMMKFIGDNLLVADCHGQHVIVASPQACVSFFLYHLLNRNGFQ